MSNPTFEKQLKTLQKHCKLLLNQPIIEFQEKNNVLIDKIEVELGLDNSICEIKITVFSKPFKS